MFFSKKEHHFARCIIFKGPNRTFPGQKSIPWGTRSIARMHADPLTGMTCHVLGQFWDSGLGIPTAFPTVRQHPVKRVEATARNCCCSAVFCSRWSPRQTAMGCLDSRSVDLVTFYVVPILCQNNVNRYVTKSHIAKSCAMSDWTILIRIILPMIGWFTMYNNTIIQYWQMIPWIRSHVRSNWNFPNFQRCCWCCWCCCCCCCCCCCWNSNLPEFQLSSDF